MRLALYKVQPLFHLEIKRGNWATTSSGPGSIALLTFFFLSQWSKVEQSSERRLILAHGLEEYGSPSWWGSNNRRNLTAMAVGLGWQEAEVGECWHSAGFLLSLILIQSRIKAHRILLPNSGWVFLFLLKPFGHTLTDNQYDICDSWHSQVGDQN